MKFRFISDQRDPLGDLNTSGEDTNFLPASFFHASFSPAAGHGDGSQPAATPPAISPALTPNLPAESIEAQATQNGSGGPGSVVAVTSASSGFTINLIFDAAAMAAPSSFRAGIQQAASILSATITNKITVNINIDYSGTGGGAAAGPDNGLFENYSTVRTDLINNAAPGDATFNALPTGSTIQGQSNVAVWNAQLKLFGLLGANDTTTDDGSATFATDISSSLLVGVALHELTHALGRVPFGASANGFAPDIFDFYRFTNSTTRLFTDNIPASAAYFSVNGGSTDLADFGVHSDPSDFLNPANSALPGPYSNLTPNDAFNELYGSGTIQRLSAVDKQMLDALGFNTIPQGIVVAATASEALQGGTAVSLLSGAPVINDPASATLSSATIKIANTGGIAVTGDQLFVNGVQNGSVGNGVTASWSASTGTLTLTGSASIAVYDTLLSEVSYQDTGTDTSSGSHPVRTVTWTVSDGTNSYNTTSQITIDRLPVTTNDAANDVVGSTVSATAANGVLSNDSDLDGDKLAVIGVSDATKGAGSVGASLGGVYGHLTLNADGSYSYVADNTSAINSAPNGSHLHDAFTYTVSDRNGGTAAGTLTITLDRAPIVTASNVVLGTGQTSVAASSLFTASDPDGNAISTYGFMDTGGGHFVLNGVVQANNQEIDVTAAELSQLTYQGVPGSSVDTLQIRVNDGTLWSSWASFKVTTPLVIKSSGSTSLVQVGSNYFLNPVGGGTGPELFYSGAPVTAGMFGAWWAPVGAEQVGSGYDVVWLNSSNDLFSIWSTDSNGNYITNLASNLSGTSSTLENYETIFHQDLNGDHVIGPPTTLIKSSGSTSLVQVGSNYFLNPVGGGTGPELFYSGAPVTAGMFGAWWAPVGAEQVGSGYDVVWLNSSNGLFSIWSTDSNGNYITNLASNLSGTSSTLENYETIFHQDLNGDHVIGPPTTLIKSSGSTSLVQVGSNYFLNPVGGGTGPELFYSGAPVTAGMFGAWWAPVGAEQVGSGYDVVWLNSSNGLFSIWSTDSNGNYITNLASNLSGTSSTLENYETIFHQDLNGDHVIGPPTTLIESSGSTSLVQVGSNYFLNPVGGGTGPELFYSGAPVTAGMFGAWWAPVGAEQVGSGYDVVWLNSSNGLFSIWSTDSNGNYITNLASNLSGTSSTLESYETIFHQDLNGDGVTGIYAAPNTTLLISTPLTGTSGSATIGTGGTFELAAADSASVTFGSSTGMLKLDSPSTFSGLILNFAGNGTLPGSDQIDLKGINFNSVHDTYASGVLSVTDGTNTATLDFNGSYTLANFKFANDGSGGTIVYDPPAPGQSGPENGAASTGSQNTVASNLVVTVGHDSFVFGPNFGQATIADFNPATDAIHFGRTVFANLDAVLSATHDDGHGNSVISATAHDTITIQHVTTAQLLAHQSDFHFV